MASMQLAGGLPQVLDGPKGRSQQVGGLIEVGRGVSPGVHYRSMNVKLMMCRGAVRLLCGIVATGAGAVGAQTTEELNNDGRNPLAQLFTPSTGSDAGSVSTRYAGNSRLSVPRP